MFDAKPNKRKWEKLSEPELGHDVNIERGIVNKNNNSDLDRGCERLRAAQEQFYGWFVLHFCYIFFQAFYFLLGFDQFFI